jgi:small-conductance mechanosensitive channel
MRALYHRLPAHENPEGLCYRSRVLRWGGALLLLAVAVSTAGAAETSDDAFARQLDQWSRALDRIEALGEGAPTMEELDVAFGEAARIVRDADTLRSVVALELAPIQQELKALGPRPAAGAPAETDTVRALRERLEARLATIDARAKQAEVVVARAEGLRHQMRLLARAKVAKRLLTRGPPPLDPATWPPALASWRAFAAEFARVVREWPPEGIPVAHRVRHVLWVLFLVTLAFAAMMPVRTWLLRTFGRDPTETEPDAARRLVAAAAECAARCLLLCVPIVVFMLTIRDIELVAGTPAIVVRAAASSLLLLVIVLVFAHTALPQDAPRWRLVPLDDRATRSTRRRIQIVAAMLFVVSFIHRSTYTLDQEAPELVSLLSVAILVPFAAILLPLASRRMWQGEEAARVRASGPWLFFDVVVGTAVIAMPLAALAGWARLAFDINRGLILAGLIAGGFIVVRTLIGAVLDRIASAPGSGGDPRAAVESAASFWVRLAADVVLFPLAVLIWMLGLGVPLNALLVWIGAALHTIEIGSLRIAPADVVAAVAACAIIIGITRFFIRTLERRILPRTELALGTQQTLTAGISYVGLAMAIAVGVSTLGLDLSNLALVAGALSVGIGFGMQNIVNNFVSGIIMLVERPIKVGDWVVIGAHEGTVRRINVRATEIESFQRSAVLIPNSEVLSSAVVNWTHRDKSGRLDVAVSVAYGSDVEQVRELLLKCARAHKEVASVPPPYVLFRDFGDSGLAFELRAFLVNVEERLRVTSDLRFAIDAAFRRAKIEIPFPQRDLRLRDIDRLERALAGRAASPKPDGET